MVQARQSGLTRDYVITQDSQYDDTLINVFGGKCTTYRKLAEGVLAAIGSAPAEHSKRWTAVTALPGGDFAVFRKTLANRSTAPLCIQLIPLLVRRLAHLSTLLKFGRFSKTVSRSVIWALISDWAVSGRGGLLSP